MLDIEPCALTPAMRRDLEVLADVSKLTRQLVTGYSVLTVLCALPIAAFFILVGMMEDKAAVTTGSMLTTAALAFIAGMILAGYGVYTPWRKAIDEARIAAGHLKRGTAELVRFEIPERHLVIDNDGQLLCFFAGSRDKALFFNVGGHEADPRLAAHEQGGLFRKMWSWKRIAGFPRLWDFEAGGQTLESVNIARPHDNDPYDWEAALGFERWPVDGEIVSVTAAKLEKIGNSLRKYSPSRTAAPAD